MSRSQLSRSLRSWAAPGPGSARSWGLALALLVVAIGAGVLLVQLLMSPPSAELRDLAAYLAIAGLATTVTGWLALRALDRAVGLSLQAKAFLGASLATTVALVNVFIVARLMFVNTSHDLQLLLALLVFSGVVTLVLSLWVAATVSDRVAGIASAIRALAGGRYENRLRLSGGDEVANLAADVDVLAQRLQEAEHQREQLDRERRELTASISHDLRTPLASVRAMVEALSDEVVEDPVEVGRYYTNIRREVERLSRMIDDLFELAQIDAGALTLRTRALTLQEVAAEVVDAMQAQALRRDVTLAIEVEGEPPALPLDGARIERAVANLVRNALEHTPAGGAIRVAVIPDGDGARLSVVDGGSGIAPGDLPHIWDRFYRGGKSRSRPAAAADGAGLGLAIVQGIVEAHGGVVGARSEPGAGAVFTMRLPMTAGA